MMDLEGYLALKVLKVIMAMTDPKVLKVLPESPVKMVKMEKMDLVVPRANLELTEWTGNLAVLELLADKVKRATKGLLVTKVSQEHQALMETPDPLVLLAS